MNKQLNRRAIFDNLERGRGFSVLSIDSQEEMEVMWDAVIESFGYCFNLKKPSKEIMKNIHKEKNLQNDFANLSVFKRTLKKDAAFSILNLRWIKKLTDELKMYPSDPYKLGYPCFTWRLVRPKATSDYRNVHKDQWFRIALKGTKHPNCIPGPKIIDKNLPSQLQTIKVWLALNVKPGLSGLMVSPESQKDDFPSFSLVKKDGLEKPLVNEKEANKIKFENVLTNSGDYVLFGEQLMHGGAPTNTSDCRISMEFELSSKNQKIYKNFQSN